MVAFRETHVRIVAIPPGEAPKEIREHWVGLILPLAVGHSSAVEIESCGVLSGKMEDMAIGYVVEIEDALAVLTKKSPEAAAWWRENAPHLLGVDGELIFHEHVCELCDPDEKSA